MAYNMELAAGHADVFRHSHPAVHPQLKGQLADYIRCSDGAAGHMETRAEVEVSWHWMKLHCPFARHPTPPQQLLDWAHAATNGYRVSTTLTFTHPLFVTANSSSEIRRALEQRTDQLRVEAQRQNISMTDARVDWFEVDANSTAAGSAEGNQEGKLRVPMCMGCVPSVSVSFCSAPLLNGAMRTDVRSHIAYHVALGVERFHLYDRFGLYEAVLNDYIAAGIVDYRRLPLPHKSVLDPMKERYPHGQHWVRILTPTRSATGRQAVISCSLLLLTASLPNTVQDQNLALEVCHMRQLQTAEWFCTRYAPALNRRTRSSHGWTNRKVWSE